MKTFHFNDDWFASDAIARKEIKEFIRSLTETQIEALVDENLTKEDVKTLVKTFQQQKQANIEFWKLPCLNQT